MTTSIADLLEVLAHATVDSARLELGDTAKALDVIGRTLTRLRADGLGAGPTRTRDDVVRRLADECAEAASSFEHKPGRISDLTGVINDAVGILRPHLTDEERWSAAIGLAVIARRCAQSIARFGPYTRVPPLLAILDRSTELTRAAALSPLDPTQLRGQDIPIPSTDLSRDVSLACLASEATARLVSLFRNRSREPLGVRPLVGVCRAAETISANMARIERDTVGPSRAERWFSTAWPWRDARLALLPFDHARGADPGASNRALEYAVLIVSALSRPTDGDSRTRAEDIAAIRASALQLRLLATGCSNEIKTIGRSLVVAGGPRPSTPAAPSNGCTTRHSLQDHPTLHQC